MATTINSSTSNGIVITPDTSGEIELQANGVTKAKVTANGLQDANGNSLRGGSYRNLVINGDMRIAQRSTSVSGITSSSGTYYTVDRFGQWLSGAGTWTHSQSTDVPTGQGFSNSVKLNCTTANASLSATAYYHSKYTIEAQNLQHLKYGTSSAEKITLSFWVKSNKTGTYILELEQDDSLKVISQSYTISSADTWEKKTLTYDGNTADVINNDNGRGIHIWFWFVAGSNFTSGTLNTSWNSRTQANDAVGQVNLADSTSNYINITGVQLEVGEGASDFECLPYDVQLQRCQRYYWRWTATRDLCSAMLASTVSAYGVFAFPVKMRANPSIATEATTDVRVSWSAGTSTTSGFAIDRNSDTSCLIRLTTSGLTTGQGAWYVVDGGSISGSAEL